MCVQEDTAGNGIAMCPGDRAGAPANILFGRLLFRLRRLVELMRKESNEQRPGYGALANLLSWASKFVAVSRKKLRCFFGLSQLAFQSVQLVLTRRTNALERLLRCALPPATSD